MRTNVSFYSEGIKLAAHLYTPDDGAPGPRSAIVVSHPGSGVKEQTAGLYAERLARSGFISLTFDTAYQGQSGGSPRGLEDPAHRVEDIKAAVSFLAVQEGVDPDRIGALGICASGGYVMPAAATDHRIKAVASVSGVDMSRQFRLGPDGKQDPAVIQGMLEAAAAARTAAARGQEMASFPLFPESEEQARQGGQHLLEGWEYYCTPRAKNESSAQTFTWNSVDKIVYFDAFRVMDLISPRPVLIIAGTESITKWMAEEAFEQARDPKELVWIDGASHVDLYDKDEYVTPAVEKLTDFFSTNLVA